MIFPFFISPCKKAPIWVMKGRAFLLNAIVLQKKIAPPLTLFFGNSRLTDIATNIFNALWVSSFPGHQFLIGSWDKNNYNTAVYYWR